MICSKINKSGFEGKLFVASKLLLLGNGHLAFKKGILIDG